MSQATARASPPVASGGEALSPRWESFWYSAGPGAGAALALAVSLIAAEGMIGLGGSDPYRHLAYAHQLWKSRLELKGHPFMPFTVLGSTGVDPWRLLHLLLIPFTSLGLIQGARVAGALFAALSAFVSAWLLRRSGQLWGWVYATAPLGIAAGYMARVREARAGFLVQALALLLVFAAAGELDRPGWAPLDSSSERGPTQRASARTFWTERRVWVSGLAAYLYGWLHLSFPVVPAFAAFGAAGAWIAGDRRGWRAMVAAALGLAASLLIRSHPWTYVSVVLAYDLSALGFHGAAMPFMPLELQPMTLGALLREETLGVALLLVCWLWGRREGRVGSPAIRAATLLSCAVLLPACFFSGRFATYLTGMLPLAAAVHAPRNLPRLRRFRDSLATVGALMGLRVLLGFATAWFGGETNVGYPASYQSIAGVARQRIPHGSLIVGEDSILPQVLWSYLPEDRFSTAYDSAFLYTAQPTLFWRWVHMRQQGIDCDQPTCASHSQPDPQAVADVVHAFGSEWLVSFYLRPGFSIVNLLAAHPERFELLGTAPAPLGKISLWHVLPSPADKPWALAPAVVPVEPSFPGWFGAGLGRSEKLGD